MGNPPRFAGRASMLAMTLITTLLPLEGLAQAASPPTLSIGGLTSKVERVATPNVMPYLITRSGNLDGSTVVRVTTQAGGTPAATAGNACTAGVDYVRTSDALEFSAGDRVKVINVPICDDSLNEQNEVFNVVLSGAKNGTIVHSTAVGTILDDDRGKFNVLDVTHLESNDLPFDFRIMLSRPYPGPVSVRWITRSGSAVAGSDYQPRTGTANFSAGVTELSFSTTVIEDGLQEPDEQFVVDLFDPVGAPIATPANGRGGGTGVMTILANIR